MRRRHFLIASSAFALSFGARQNRAFAQGPAKTDQSFDALLQSTIDADEFALGRDTRERQEYEYFEFAQRGVARPPLSTAKISPRAQNLIIASEVTSPSQYENKYRGAIWPGGQSGVTIGVGYDVGYVPVEWLKEDWPTTSIPTAQQAALIPACGVRGLPAKALLPTISGIDISWPIAQAQFFELVLPRYVSETIAALPNSRELHPDCLGALVSLTYNRGAAYSRSDERFKEMRAIKRHIADKKFSLVPNEFRSMKRIWQDQNLPGLLYRRELEAKLFEEGLNA